MTTLTIEMLHEFAEAKANRPKIPWTVEDISYFCSYLSDSHIKDMIFPTSFPVDSHYAYDSLFENVVFINIHFYDFHTDETVFKKCQFINSHIRKSYLGKTEFIDCVFTGGSITRTMITDSAMTNTIISNSTLAGFSLTDSTLKDLLFWNNSIGDSPRILQLEGQGAQLIGNTFKTS